MTLGLLWWSTRSNATSSIFLLSLQLKYYNVTFSYSLPVFCKAEATIDVFANVFTLNYQTQGLVFSHWQAIPVTLLLKVTKTSNDSMHRRPFKVYLHYEFFDKIRLPMQTLPYWTNCRLIEVSINKYGPSKEENMCNVHTHLLYAPFPQSRYFKCESNCISCN